MIELTPENIVCLSKVARERIKRLEEKIAQAKIEAQTFIGIEDDCIVEGIAVIPHYSSEDLYTINTTQVGGYR